MGAILQSNDSTVYDVGMALRLFDHESNSNITRKIEPFGIEHVCTARRLGERQYAVLVEEDFKAKIILFAMKLTEDRLFSYLHGSTTAPMVPMSCIPVTVASSRCAALPRSRRRCATGQ